MIDDKMQDDTAVNCVSNFFYYFSPSLIEITYLDKAFERNDVISLKGKRGCPIAFSPVNRCLWPVYHVLMQMQSCVSRVQERIQHFS